MDNLGRQRNQLRGAKVYQSINISDRNALVQKYIGLVKKIALHVKARLPPQVDLDDLVQSGMIGLMDAINNHKPDNHASFETYAGIRIRGSIIDHLRMYDWTPRTVHQNTRAINAAYDKLSQQLGRNPEPVEMAAELNVDVVRYKQMLSDYAQSGIKTLSETGLTDETIAELPCVDLLTGEVDSSNRIFDKVAYDEMCVDLARSISELGERERQVVSLYYDHEMNLREIGLILKLSESRACQLLAAAVDKLKENMSALWGDGDRGFSAQDCLGVRPRESIVRTRENLTVQGALPVKQSKMHTDLFADIESELEQANKNKALQQSRPTSRKTVIDGLEYDNERFFHSYKDCRYKDTLSQKFASNELQLPQVEIVGAGDPDNSLQCSCIHSSRPRITFANLAEARAAALKW